MSTMAKIQEQPEQETKLRNLTKQFRDAISGCMDLTYQIDNKVEKIGFLPEPQIEDKEIEKGSPNNFIEEMYIELDKLRTNNRILEQIVGRLIDLI